MKLTEPQRRYILKKVRDDIKTLKKPTKSKLVVLYSLEHMLRKRNGKG